MPGESTTASAAPTSALGPRLARFGSAKSDWRARNYPRLGNKCTQSTRNDSPANKPSKDATLNEEELTQQIDALTIENPDPYEVSWNDALERVKQIIHRE